MKLVCSQSELNAALQLVSRAVASRPTHPVLANVLLTADAGTNRISLTGFDLNLGIQTAFSASVEVSGAITLPARLMGEIVSKLSNEAPLTLKIEENGEQVELMSKSGNYQMRGMSADDFPELPLVQTGKALKLNSTALVDALRGTIFSTSSDEAKQILTGVNLVFNNQQLEAAATDGHRLAVKNLTDVINSDSSDQDDDLEKFSVTIPARSLREIERLIVNPKSDETTSLFYDTSQVVFISSDQVVTTRILEGTYPNYRQLIPDEFLKSIEFNRKDFISSLERIAVLADQHNNVIKIQSDEASQTVLITADAQDVGSGSESIKANFKGGDIQIAFNVRYLLEGIKAINSERILLRCNAPTTPAVFSPVENIDHFIYLVMPVQIRT